MKNPNFLFDFFMGCQLILEVFGWFLVIISATIFIIIYSLIYEIKYMFYKFKLPKRVR